MFAKFSHISGVSMRQFSHFKGRQTGFTLIELIIVIVIIGILAAVAIPKLSEMTEQAKTAKNAAILGALKSAWTIAFGQAVGVAPTPQQVADQMADPTCTLTTTTLAAHAGAFSCVGSTTTFPYAVDAATSTKIASPAAIRCLNTDCSSTP
jgi:prepilin-type N-terminal cleavage/methylation domain-containing protein